MKETASPAIEEALTIGREAGLPVEISHFKLSGQQNWGPEPDHRSDDRGGPQSWY